MPLSPTSALTSPTPAAWAAAVLTDPIALLDDHAHLERNAAGNALDLIRSNSYRADRTRWVARLSAIARDEVEHLAAVNRELERRDATVTHRHTNPYAASLRGLVRRGAGPAALVDRLLVSGLIEARSHERFVLLASTDHDLAPLYDRLAVSEAGHHRVFVRLAEEVGAQEDVGERWRELATAEAAVLEGQPPGPRMHSGVPSA